MSAFDPFLPLGLGCIAPTVSGSLQREPGHVLVDYLVSIETGYTGAS
jgi:hypothetical protein